jgi:hypothetical protein
MIVLIWNVNLHLAVFIHIFTGESKGLHSEVLRGSAVIIRLYNHAKFLLLYKGKPLQMYIRKKMKDLKNQFPGERIIEQNDRT